MSLHLVATCALGLEEFLSAELTGLGVHGVEIQRGAVTFVGHDWSDVWRANWRLRTANRVLVRLAEWPAGDADALTAGARKLTRSLRHWHGLASTDLLNPDRTFALRATSSASRLTDTRWIALRVKDGLVDGQRDRFGERASVERQDPDVALRVWLHQDQATLLLDTSGDPLDRRGYRLQTTEAPVRENLAAACVLASGWDGTGPVVDPMCGSGTLLIEAAWFALGRPPGCLRGTGGQMGWAFQKLPNYDASAFRELQVEPLPAPGPDVQLYGVDTDRATLGATRKNLQAAGLHDRAQLLHHSAFNYVPPEYVPPECVPPESVPPEGVRPTGATPGRTGLVLINPAYGERLPATKEQWRKLGDLLKQRYKGWKAVVLAGGEDRGKHIGLKPERRIPVRNGPLEARILLFDLY